MVSKTPVLMDDFHIHFLVVLENWFQNIFYAGVDG
jgi:hypothetical protein